MRIILIRHHNLKFWTRNLKSLPQGLQSPASAELVNPGLFEYPVVNMIGIKQMPLLEELAVRADGPEFCEIKQEPKFDERWGVSTI